MKGDNSTHLTQHAQHLLSHRSVTYWAVSTCHSGVNMPYVRVSLCQVCHLCVSVCQRALRYVSMCQRQVSRTGRTS